MITISSFLFLIWSLLNVMIYMRIFKKKIGLMMPISFICQSLICILSAIIFHDALLIPLWISLLGIVFSVYKLISDFFKNKKAFYDYIKNYFNISFVIYLFLFIFVIFIERNRTITRTDDLMHWGLFVMDILETHELPIFLNESSYTWFHADYPQLFSVFESFFNYICINGYVEWYSISAIIIFGLSFFLPIFDNANNILKSIGLLAIIILVGFCVSNLSFDPMMAMFYDGLSVDYILGIMVAFGIYLVYKFNFKYFYDHVILMIVLVGIVNVKQIAICFYLLIIFALLLKQMLNKEKISLLYMIYLLPLLSFVHWNYLVKNLNQQGQFQIDNLELNILSIANGIAGEPWQTVIIKKYFDRILFGGITQFIIPLPFFVVVFILVIFNILFAKINNHRSLSSNIVLILGALGYSFALFLTYVYLFGESEGVELASFDRYIQTYTILMISFIVMMNGEYFFNHNTKNTIAIIVMMSIMIDFNSFATLRQNRSFCDDELTFELLNYQNELLDNEKILVINQYTDDFDIQYERNVALRYYMAKDYQRKAMENITFVAIYPEGNWNDLFVEYKIIKNVQDFKKYIANYNFIYHYQLNDEYINLFNQAYDEVLLNDRLYRVKDEKIILIDHENTIENTRD